MGITQTLMIIYPNTLWLFTIIYYSPVYGAHVIPLPSKEQINSGDYYATLEVSNKTRSGIPQTVSESGHNQTANDILLETGKKSQENPSNFSPQIILDEEQKTLDFARKKPIKPVGTLNPNRSNSFMTSTLQALYHIPRFRRHIYRMAVASSDNLSALNWSSLSPLQALAVYFAQLQIIQSDTRNDGLDDDLRAIKVNWTLQNSLERTLSNLKKDPEGLRDLQVSLKADCDQGVGGDPIPMDYHRMGITEYLLFLSRVIGPESFSLEFVHFYKKSKRNCQLKIFKLGRSSSPKNPRSLVFEDTRKKNLHSHKCINDYSTSDFLNKFNNHSSKRSSSDSSDDSSSDESDCEKNASSVRSTSGFKTIPFLQNSEDIRYNHKPKYQSVNIGHTQAYKSFVESESKKLQLTGRKPYIYAVALDQANLSEIGPRKPLKCSETGEIYDLYALIIKINSKQKHQKVSSSGDESFEGKHAGDLLSDQVKGGGGGGGGDDDDKEHHEYSVFVRVEANFKLKDYKSRELDKTDDTFPDFESSSCSSKDVSPLCMSNPRPRSTSELEQWEEMLTPIYQSKHGSSVMQSIELEKLIETPDSGPDVAVSDDDVHSPDSIDSNSTPTIRVSSINLGQPKRKCPQEYEKIRFSFASTRNKPDAVHLFDDIEKKPEVCWYHIRDTCVETVSSFAEFFEREKHVEKAPCFAIYVRRDRKNHSSKASSKCDLLPKEEESDQIPKDLFQLAARLLVDEFSVDSSKISINLVSSKTLTDNDYREKNIKPDGNASLVNFHDDLSSVNSINGVDSDHSPHTFSPKLNRKSKNLDMKNETTSAQESQTKGYSAAIRLSLALVACILIMIVMFFVISHCMNKAHSSINH